MYPPVVTKDPTAVEVEVQAAYLAIFPDGDRVFVPRAFGWANDCFAGNYRDYQPVDVPYHDFEHTLQGTLCMARLLLGRHLAGERPLMTQKMFELGLLAILLHDTGYLKQQNDTDGTGAKYTVTHVDRSVEFAGGLLAEKGFNAEDITAVQNMILCTGVDAALDMIPFKTRWKRLSGSHWARRICWGRWRRTITWKNCRCCTRNLRRPRVSSDKTHSWACIPARRI